MTKITFQKQRFKTQFRFRITKIILFLKGVEVLNIKQINALFSQIQNKNQTIIKKLQQGKLTLDLVVAVNFDYQSHFLDFKFIKTGNEALIKAANRFEIPLSAKKISFTQWWIRQDMVAEINSNNLSSIINYI